MVQCVPELQLVYTPEKSNNKPEATGKRNRPRMKITPQRKSSEKAPKKKRKSSKHSISVATQILNVTSESVSTREGMVGKSNHFTKILAIFSGLNCLLKNFSNEILLHSTIPLL
jgi:hypothetical protein